jgi:hypothetical protein
MDADRTQARRRSVRAHFRMRCARSLPVRISSANRSPSASTSARREHSDLPLRLALRQDAVPPPCQWPRTTVSVGDRASGRPGSRVSHASWAPAVGRPRRLLRGRIPSSDWSNGDRAPSSRDPKGASVWIRQGAGHEAFDDGGPRRKLCPACGTGASRTLTAALRRRRVAARSRMAISRAFGRGPPRRLVTGLPRQHRGGPASRRAGYQARGIGGNASDLDDAGRVESRMTALSTLRRCSEAAAAASGRDARIVARGVKEEPGRARQRDRRSTTTERSPSPRQVRSSTSTWMPFFYAYGRAAGQSVICDGKRSPSADPASDGRRSRRRAHEARKFGVRSGDAVR